MIRQLAILLPMLLLTNSRCTEGCLRCTSDNKCLYCDVFQDFRLMNGRCVKQETNNCVLVNDKNQCLKCKEQFYLDQVSSQCVELFDKIRVENCAHHLAPKKCAVCKQGHVLQNDLCVKIAQPIQNCAIENQRAECEQCKSGYILSLDYKSCNQAPQINKCGTYSHVKCTTCKPNYFYNENYYSDQLFGFDNAYQFRLLHRMRQDEQNEVVDSHKFSTCQKQEVRNCLIFENFESCKKCKEGFFVNPKQKCEPIPATSLQNCLRYSSATTCIDCAPGFFLKSNTECLPVIPIQNCMLYKTNANFSSCLRCTNNYYLSAENLCTRRTDISNIDLCEKLSDQFEKCEVCAEGYRPTTDGFRCLPKIKNCNTYGFTNTNSFSHTCTLCHKGYYYNEDDKVCIKGKVPFCEEYDYDDHKCVKCVKNFYLNSGKCEAHQKLPFCTNYSVTNKNVCTQCEPNSMLFTQTGSCEKVERIPFCAEYENKTYCKRCKDGYYARTQTTCELIPPQRNCLQLDSEDFECKKCLPGYLIHDGDCVKPEPYLINGCKEWKDDGTGELDDFKCESCKLNFVPVEFQDTFACKRIEDMARKQLESTELNLDPHCAQFKEEDDKFECVKCKKDFYLVDHTCAPNCYEPEKLTVYRQWVSIDNRNGDDVNESLMIQRTNVCEKTIPNCAVASLDIYQDFVNIRYVCEKCVNGFLPVITKGNITTHVYRELSIHQHMPLSSTQGVRCVKPEDYIVVGDTKGSKPVKDCELYEEISKGVLGCKSCAFSFVGTVNQLVRQCKVFDQDETCKECNDFHYLKNDYECSPVEIIEHCVDYDGESDHTKCEECQQDFFVSDNKCVPRMNSLAKMNCELKKDEDVCECNDGYILNPQKQECERMPDDCVKATFNNGEIVCNECNKSKSYLKDNMCRKGIIQNCVDYDQATGKCVKCVNGFYKDQPQANLCLGHSNNRDQKCKEWSQNEKDKCEECTSDSTLFDKVNECREITNQIPNCKVYRNEFECKICNQGYYLNNVSKTCLTIPEELHCNKLSVVEFANEGNTVDDYTVDNKFLHTCDVCKPGYFRKLEQVDIHKKQDPTKQMQFMVFRCKDWLSYMRLNCEETQIDGTRSMGKISCQGCKSQYFPYSLKDKMVCIDRDYIKERKNGFVQDSNCLAYEFSSNKMKCLECKYPKLLKNDACVDSCSTGEIKYAVYIDSNKRYKKNVCVKGTTVTNCEWHVPAEASFTTTNYANTYTCFQCSSGFQKVQKAQNTGTGTGGKLKVTMFNPYTNKIEINAIGDTYAEFDCVKISDKTVRGLLKADKKEVENCDLYVPLDATPNSYGCKKCKFGYRGRVVKTGSDTESHIEYCEVFDDCDTNVVGGLSTNTGLETSVGPLNSYMSCYACKNGKVLMTFWDLQAASLNLAQFQTGFIKDGTNKYTDGTDPSNSYNFQCVNSADILAAHDATDAVSQTKIIKKTVAADALVDNCAMMVVNAADTGMFSTTNQYCVSCLPTYKPTLAGNTVTTCTKIVAVTGTNCPDVVATEKYLLNQCQKCVWTIDGSKNLVKNVAPTCLDTVIALPNCYAGLNDGSKNVCKVCNPGYEIDTTGKCYQIKVDGNGERKMNFFDTFWTNAGIDGVNWRNFSHLALQQTYQGESHCKNEDVLYKVTNVDDNLGMTVCATELDHQNTYQTALNSFLNGANSSDYVIAGCARYGFINNKLVCLQCQNTYIITLDYKCLNSSDALNNTNLQNCLKAEKEGSAVCVECAADYRNVGGLCMDTQPTETNFDNKTNKDYFVKNCKVYSDLTRLNYKGICQECDENFYIKNLISPFNKCEAIPAWAGQCKDFLDNTGCVKCKMGYGLVDIKGEGDSIRRACVEMGDNPTATDNKFKHDPNCEELVGVGDTESLTKQKLKCQKCKDNFVLVETIDKFKQRCYSVVPPINKCAEYEFAENEVEKIKKSTFKCKKCEDKNLQFLDLVDNVCTDRVNKNNCEKFDEFSDRCLKCVEGFRLDEKGEVCTDLKTNKRQGYLQTCKQNKQCDHRFRYEGLNAQLNSLFTCHMCREQGQIPFVIVNIKEKIEENQLEDIEGLNHNVKGMKQWDINNDQQSQQLLQCMKPEANSFNLKTNTTLQLPTQCALGMVDLSKQDQNDFTYDASQSNNQNNPDLTKTGVRCVACQPKYKPTRATVQKVVDGKNKDFQLDLLVTQCTLIANCETSTWFNACTQCAPGYGYNYNKKQGILYDECVSVGTNKYCSAMDSVTSRCVYCQKGTFMNEDGVCEIINPEKCEFGQFRYRGVFEQRDLQKAIFHTNEIVGCNKCQPGYAPVLIEKPTKICTHSMYHVQKSFVSETQYIENCQSYGLDKLNQLVCRECAQGFVLSSQHSKKCFAVAELQNCTRAFNEKVCVECADGFVLVNSQCETPKIQKCKEYGNNELKKECPLCTQNEQKCIECEEEHYLEGGKCLKGKVRNCEHLETDTQCIECKDGYTLINMKGGESYCYPNDPRFNCKEFDQEKLQSGVLECEECKDDSYVFSLSRTDSKKKTCMPFDFVPGCVKYNNNPIALADSGFDCVKCNPKTYLDNGQCKDRVNMPDECIEYAIDLDQCVSCQEGYYISQDAKNCVAYPQGLFGCLVYQSKTVCAKCDTQFVLKDEICIKVEVEIPNCKYYEDLETCLECETGFVNRNGRCEQPFALECQTYRDSANCATCLPNFHLELNDKGVTNCVADTIQNCSVYSELAPYGCLACSGEQYVLDGACVAVTEKIEGCIEYSDANVCKTCSSDYAIKYDGSVCLRTPEVVSQIDLNCEVSVLTEQPTCNTCQPGFYFVYGQCVSCPKRVLESGCYTCDPRRPSRCLMCQSGYIQSPEGDCVKPMIESYGIHAGEDLDDVLVR